MISVIESCSCGAKISVVATGDDSAEDTLADFRKTHKCHRKASGAEAVAEAIAWDLETPRCAYCGGVHEGNCPEYIREDKKGRSRK